MTKIILILIWFGLGIVGVGISNAYFQRNWPDQCNGRQDLGQSMVFVFGGPVYTVIVFLMSGFAEHGWSLALIANPRCKRLSK